LSCITYLFIIKTVQNYNLFSQSQIYTPQILRLFRFIPLNMRR